MPVRRGRAGRPRRDAGRADRGGRVRLARLPAGRRPRASGTGTGCTAPTTRAAGTAATRPSCCSTRTARPSTARCTGTRRCSATASATRAALNTADSAPYMPKNVVINPFFDWGDDRPPRIPVPRDGHLRGPRPRPDPAPPGRAGRSSGAPTPGWPIPAVIEHLTRLGVTAVELMPVHQFVPEHSLLARGLTNYWGYNTIGFLAPHNGVLVVAAARRAGRRVQGDGQGAARGRDRGDPRRGVQPHRRGRPPGPDAVLPRHRQRRLLPAPRRRPAATTWTTRAAATA